MPDYVNWLRHASPYINAHRDCTFVVMLPGDGVEHPNFGNIVHDRCCCIASACGWCWSMARVRKSRAAWPIAA